MITWTHDISRVHLHESFPPVPPPYMFLPVCSRSLSSVPMDTLLLSSQSNLLKMYSHWVTNDPWVQELSSFGLFAFKSLELSWNLEEWIAREDLRSGSGLLLHLQERLDSKGVYMVLSSSLISRVLASSYGPCCWIFPPGKGLDLG